jgi:hypothetical protein
MGENNATTPFDCCMGATQAQDLGAVALTFDLTATFCYLARQPERERPVRCIEQGQSWWTAVETDYVQIVVGKAA